MLSAGTHCRNAFLQWRDVTKDKALIASKVDLLYPVSLSLRYLRLWTNYNRRSRKLRACLLYFFQSWSARKSRNVLFSLRDYADTRLIHRKNMFTAIHFHLVSSLSRFFSDWKLARQLKHNKEFYRKVAYAKWSFTRQKIAFRAWTCFVTLEHEKRIIVKIWQRKLLWRCFHYWYSRRKSLSDSESESSPDSRLEKDMLLLVVDSHFKRKKQRLIVSAWSKLASSRSSVKLTVDTFYRDKVLYKILHKSLHCWMEYHSRRKLQRAQGKMAERRWRSYRIRSCMKWWIVYHASKACQQRREDLGSKHWKAGIARKSVFHLMEYCFWRKWRQERKGVAHRQWTTFRLRGCFRRWIRFTSKATAKKEMNERATNAWAEVVTRRAFFAWSSVSRRRRNRRMVLEEQFNELIAILKLSRLANAWRFWQHFVKHAAVKSSKDEKAECFRREHSARAVLRAWSGIRTSSTSERQAGLIYTKLLQRLAFLGWFQVQKSRTSNREPRISQQEQPDSAVSKHVSRVRPAPRRPSIAFSDIHTLLSQSPAFDVSSMSAQSGTRDMACFSKPDDTDPHHLLRKRLNAETNKDFHSKAATTSSLDLFSCLDSSEPDLSHVIADEVAWMEQLLAGFEDLRAELVEKRAEFALVMEKNVSGSRDKAQLLAQKISLLQQRRAILLPTIQAVASVVPGLRCRGRKVADYNNNFRK